MARPLKLPNIQYLRKTTRSRFALNAGEGAHVPSNKWFLKLKLTHYRKKEIG